MRELEMWPVRRVALVDEANYVDIVRPRVVLEQEPRPRSSSATWGTYECVAHVIGRSGVMFILFEKPIHGPLFRRFRSTLQ
jgi:hypothetical protein